MVTEQAGSMIVKVQRSVRTSHEVAQILVYNKKRTFMQQFNADKVTELLPLKSYWKAHVEEDDTLTLDEMVDERNW